MLAFDKPNRSKAYALLLDPDKARLDKTWIQAIKECNPDFMLLGGSQPFPFYKLDALVQELKKEITIPLVGFPGSIDQVHSDLDALLALSVVQSTDARFILSPLFKIRAYLKCHRHTTFFTPYLLLGNTGKTSVEQILADKIDLIENLDSLDAYLCGLSILKPQTIYLEAGSGSSRCVKSEYVIHTKSILPNSYLICGGGIRSADQGAELWQAGADAIVVGNWAEDSLSALYEISEMRNRMNL